MAQELRSILFSEEEVATAVGRLMAGRARIPSAGSVLSLAIREAAGAVQAAVRMRAEPDVEYVLGPHELMTAMLLHCRGARIPLHARSIKRLAVLEGCLSLTMSLNPRRIDPWVLGDVVLHAVGDPRLRGAPAC